MKIINVTMSCYKSIYQSGTLQLHKKINIFAGKNNTGKTAFIESIYKVISGNMQDNYKMIGDKILKLQLDISISDKELAFLYKDVEEAYKIRNLDRLRVTLGHDPLSNVTKLEKVEMYYDNDFKLFYLNKSFLENTRIEYVFSRENGSGTTFGGSPPLFIINLITFLKERVVYISGSRHFPQAESTELNDTLSIDGTNLNAFMYTLHNNHEQIFDKIKGTFIRIFGDVTSISTPIRGNNYTNISIYFEGLEDPIPLANCGSGYTHVLLLLGVLFTKKESIVLYDEPQVFLHPSAEKAIYDLVCEIGDHQYLFTTHSPILINYPIEKHLFHVRKEKGESIFSQLERLQGILSDIGINNSDFALSEKVLFVEGETEEIVIPKILSHFGMKQIGYNYRVLNMKGTGNEFNRKSAMANHKGKLDLILGGISDSPIPYRIIIDADDKKEEKLTEIKSTYGENIVILDRREFENYFLDCYGELSEVINFEIGAESTNPDEVKNKIEIILSNTNDKKVYPRDSLDKLKNSVGSEVLERLFVCYSLNYNKLTHGLLLTDLVLKNIPEKLEFFKNELTDFIKD